MLQFPYKLDSVLSQIKNRYSDDLEDFREYIKIDFSNELLSDDFHQTFFQLIQSEELNKYSPLKYYWLKMVEDFFYILELHYDEEDGGLSDDDQEFTEDEREEELLAAWEQTSFASALEGMIEEGLSPIDSSMALVPLMESQILSFAYLHFYRDEFECETAFLYNMAPQFGDYETRLNMLGSHQYVDFESALELYPAVPIAEVDTERKMIGLDNNGETDYLSIVEHSRVLNLSKGKKIFFIPGVEVSSEQLDTLQTQLEKEILSNRARLDFFINQVSYVVLSSMSSSSCKNLPEVLHITPWGNPTQLTNELDQAIASLALEHLELAWELVTEDDVNPRLQSPFDGKKSLLMPIIQELIKRYLLGALEETHRAEFKKLYSSGKNADLVVPEVRRLLEVILK